MFRNLWLLPRSPSDLVFAWGLGAHEFDAVGPRTVRRSKGAEVRVAVQQNFATLCRLPQGIITKHQHLRDSVRFFFVSKA